MDVNQKKYYLHSTIKNVFCTPTVFLRAILKIINNNYMYISITIP